VISWSSAQAFDRSSGSRYPTPVFSLKSAQAVGGMEVGGLARRRRVRKCMKTEGRAAEEGSKSTFEHDDNSLWSAHPIISCE
jgi:hypothetical protein